MAKIGSLILTFKAKTKKFERSMDRASSKLKKFGKVALKFAAVAAAAVAAGLTLMIKSSLQSIDAIGKLSDRLEVSTEFLKGFGFAAEQAGGSAEGAFKTIERFSVKLGEALRDTAGITAKAFETMGVSVQELSSLGTGKAILKTIDNLNKMTNIARRSEAAFAIFGKRNSFVLNLGSNEDIKKQQKLLEALGGTFTREEAAKVERFNDAMNRLVISIKGLVETLTIALSGPLATIADFLSAIIVAVTSSSVLSAIAKWGSITVAALASVLLVATAVAAVISRLIVLVTGAPFLATLTTWTIATLKLFGILTAVAALDFSIFKILGFDTGFGVIDEFNKSQEKRKSQLNGLKQSAEEFSTPLNRALTLLEAINKQIKDFGKTKIDLGILGIETTIKSLEKQIDKMRNARTSFRSFGKTDRSISVGFITDEINALRTTIDELREAELKLQRLNEVFGPEDSIFEQQAEDALDAIKKINDEALDLKESLRTAAEVFADEMKKINLLRFNQLIDDETFNRARKRLEEIRDSANQITLPEPPKFEEFRELTLSRLLLTGGIGSNMNKIQKVKDSAVVAEVKKLNDTVVRRTFGAQLVT